MKAEKMINELPEGWKEIQLWKACEKISLNGIKIKQKDYLEEGKYPVVDQGHDLVGGYFNDDKLLVPNEPPYIIFGDHTRVKKYVNFKFVAGADGVKVLKPSLDFDPKFFFYSLFTVTIPDKGYARHFQFIEKAFIPFPPKEVQQQIVSKIEELFSELDKSIEELKTAQQQLKVYRQAVLKWAFEGRLTNENVREGELPKGWITKPLGELMESVRNGYSKKPDENGDFKILRISSVRPNKVDINEVRSLKNEIGEENSVIENDLLFTRYNGSIDFVGVCGRVPKLSNKLFYPDKLIRCRPLNKEPYHSVYLQYATNYGSARKFVLNRIKTTAGQTGISGSDIKQIPIPLASAKEQQLIVQEIVSRLSVCDKIEETINDSVKQAEALRQSILKKAFEGQLL
jgi:type I restriction enzyme, S subunit